MKGYIFLLFTVFVLATFANAQDHISNLLRDKRYIERQIDCILDRGYCDIMGRKFKEWLPEAVNNHCRRCTPWQAAQTQTLITFMQQNYSHMWNLIVQRYETTGYYFD
ncbi:Allergen Tha p 1 [Anthophora quadrimaculata]